MNFVNDELEEERKSEQLINEEVIINKKVEDNIGRFYLKRAINN